MIITSLPILLVDLIGSVLMIVLSFLCLNASLGLKRREPDQVIWTYLQWICIGLAAFAISRSAGHILKQVLVLSGHGSAWKSIRPFSGAFNSLMFAFVASVTLFFETIWKIYQQILGDKRALQAAHGELLDLNQNLERRVVARTEALSRSEHKFRRIYENSQDVIVVTDGTGRILDMNPAGEEMFGNANDRSGRQTLSFRNFFLSPDDWHPIDTQLRRQGFVTTAEARLRRRDGDGFLALISASLDRSESGKSETTHFLVKDIEQHRRMEQQLAQADKLASIGELSAGIAHEINNPLGIILGYTQLMLREEPEGSDRRADLKTIEKHARSSQAIVADLLNFARRSKPEKRQAQIHDIISDVVHFVFQHGKMDLDTIATHFSPKMPRLCLDQKKIHQVMLNLIMNAKHAVGDAGRITISTDVDTDRGQVLVQVADTGYGIAEKDLKRIFDPFFTTKPTGEGTGLGLSVSYGIIKNHGGDIRVQSQPGKGSVFTISLPISPHDESNSQ